MKPPSDPFEELTELASRLLDGELPEAGTKRLADLLDSLPGAQDRFVRMCELHAMLEGEPAAQSILSSDHLPENVVSLPGTKTLGAEAAPHEKRSPRQSLVRLSSVAALTAAALVFFSFRFGGPDPTQPNVGESDLAEPNPAEDVGKPPVSLVDAEDETSGTGISVEAEPAETSPDEEGPESQYERAVLASLGSGSQKRPPANFTGEPAPADGSIRFNRHIRPILSENCYACHGPDEASREADLRLDTLAGATGGESPVVVAGDAESSELIARITATDADDVMPPPESHKSLSPAQIELLSRWVSEGARWEDHWSFMPIANRLPEEAEGNAIDYFVDRTLERNGLGRSPEADRHTLVRRATLDLTGLPPTPEETAAFVGEEGEAAYENLIDDLMDRPSFGEHRARYWLDAARYGDTHGLHLDNYREIWPYRDWVVDAFNANKPFDEFTVEQLAGDLLPDATQEQQIATGFNRCNVTTSEGGAIEEEFLARYAVDRVSTTSTVWMGLTAGCAQCHDHKFDPITMKDFYSLYAFFNNTTQPGMDGNAKDSPPAIRAYDSPEQKSRSEDLKKRIEAAGKEAEKALKEASFEGVDLADVAPESYDHGAAEKAGDLGNRGAFSIDEPFTVAFRYKLPTEDGRTILAQRVDERERGWRVFWEDRGIIVELIESHPDKSLKRGVTRRFKAGSSGHFAVSYDGSGASDGITLYSAGDRLASRFVNRWFDSLENDFEVEGAKLRVGGKDPVSGLVPTVNEFVVYDRRLADREIKALSELTPALAIAKKAPEKRSDKEKAQLKLVLACHTEGPYRDAIASLAELQTELSRIESTTATTLVMSEKDETPKAHLLMRGEYEQKGDEVAPAFPAFLPEIDADLSMNRLGLARWLVHPDHPLTARVTVNRIWQELFGIGLVKTAEDFGTQGDNPSHPDLLDWLASTLIESGWDVKALYRTIMLSETYRQSSRLDEALAEHDPENRLLARGPRFRLDAEVIRDQALFASGLLDDTVGGPGVRPYQPAGIWEAVGYTNSNTQTFFQDYGGSAEHRRSLYSFWKRTAPPPNLALFDAPNRESCIMRRERTNTPLQALVLMNDPHFVRASRYLALRVLGEADARDERLDRMAELLRGRPLTDRERRVVVNSLDQFLNTYESDRAAAAELLTDDVNDSFSIRVGEPANVPELAAWTMVATQMLNLAEVINKN
ncbi:MAG: PSD1 and planctomycete cytochrome C domain-containing protein [Verrucomicrobiales bacterium]